MRRHRFGADQREHLGEFEKHFGRQQEIRGLKHSSTSRTPASLLTLATSQSTTPIRAVPFNAPSNDSARRTRDPSFSAAITRSHIRSFARYATRLRR
jgi:hypothetical protein